ncbi:MAG: propanediol dehydratase, small subunit [Eubacterium sp.]|jgi:propanediol dehydratase small subunit|nr:propanediol dehydratase, small subunit [Eubacterium sp.]
MDENKIEQLVKKVVEQQKQNMNSVDSVQSHRSENSASEVSAAKVPVAEIKAGSERAAVSLKDYPLQKNKPQLVSSYSGKTLDDITLENVVNEQIVPDDIKISAEVLELQAQIAEANGKLQFALNLRRAAEMTRIPDAKVLEVYELLRPRRASYEQLMAASRELDNKYNAKITAQLIKNAAEVYRSRKVLKGLK